MVKFKCVGISAGKAFVASNFKFVEIIKYTPLCYLKLLCAF